MGEPGDLSEAPTPFEVRASDERLSDLESRLRRTNWPIEFVNDDWLYGTNGGYLQELVGYWLNGYDWRAQEARINAFQHFRTSVQGLPIHFIREPGRGPDPIPLILSHGWPWTFWDLGEVIRHPGVIRKMRSR